MSSKWVRIFLCSIQVNIKLHTLSPYFLFSRHIWTLESSFTKLDRHFPGKKTYRNYWRRSLAFFEQCREWIATSSTILYPSVHMTLTRLLPNIFLRPLVSIQSLMIHETVYALHNSLSLFANKRRSEFNGCWLGSKFCKICNTIAGNQYETWRYSMQFSQYNMFFLSFGSYAVFKNERIVAIFR